MPECHFCYGGISSSMGAAGNYSWDCTNLWSGGISNRMDTASAYFWDITNLTMQQFSKSGSQTHASNAPWAFFDFNSLLGFQNSSVIFKCSSAFSVAAPICRAPLGSVKSPLNYYAIVQDNSIFSYSFTMDKIYGGPNKND